MHRREKPHKKHSNKQDFRDLEQSEAFRAAKTQFKEDSDENEMDPRAYNLIRR